ncbi:hypothetical protein PRUPE_1G002600 [Prunus persica]|uniref:Squalene cyclase N-terminal domain-containing protein n=1 Tax=Prunus persica TaxID=3760 RepID=A0A251QRK3_PRUPE|nr:hypothetical protein PRUPE_1G002600 [Prunus persica]
MWKLKIAEGGPRLSTVNNHIGRQHWEFDPDAGTPEERAQVERLGDEFKKNRFQVKQSADLLMRMQLTKENPCGGRIPAPRAVKVKETEEITEEAVTSTLRRALNFFSSIQAHDGHWPAESAGPLFFIQPLLIALHITGALNAVLGPEHQKEIIRYICNHQNEDGGWGLHIEGQSTMFGSALSYIALRLLGEDPHDDDGEEDKAVALARAPILSEINTAAPILSEINTAAVHWGSHVGESFGLAYIYLYGKRFVGPITGMVRSLRQELYTEPYHEINWPKAKNTVAKEDLYYPHPLVQDLLWGFLHHVAEPILARWPFSLLREKALKVAINHVHYEDQNSRYLCIGCVEKVLCLLACWVEDPNSEAYKLHLARIPDYFWVAEDGLKFQSFGSQTWDAVFAIQAILSCNLNDEYGPTLWKAHDFLKASQVIFH